MSYSFAQSSLQFLAARFVINDAIATVSGTAIFFAKTTLDMALGAVLFPDLLSGLNHSPVYQSGLRRHGGAISKYPTPMECFLDRMTG